MARPSRLSCAREQRSMLIALFMQTNSVGIVLAEDPQRERGLPPMSKSSIAVVVALCSAILCTVVAVTIHLIRQKRREETAESDQAHANPTDSLNALESLPGFSRRCLTYMAVQAAEHLAASVS